MPVRAWLLSLPLLIGLVPPATADVIPKPRADLLDSCAPQNLLCRHLRSTFQAVLSHRAERGDPIGIPTWQNKIRYMTVGLSDDGNLLFDDLIASFALRAGLEVERVTDAHGANVVLLVTPDAEAAVRGNRFRSLLGNAPADRERMAEELKRGFALTRVETDRHLQRMMIVHCYMAVHPDELRARPGLRFAAMIFQCLTGGHPNDEIRPSLLNRSEPRALDAPPYAKMTSLDRALLETMYGGSTLASSPEATVEKLEAKLREQGFGDDGRKR